MMGDRTRITMSNGLKGFILLLLLVIVFLIGNDTLLALMVGLAPLAFADRQASSDQTTADELDEFRARLHEVQSDAWRRRRPGRRVSPDDWWGLADVPRPQIQPVTADPQPSASVEERRLLRGIQRISRGLRPLAPGASGSVPPPRQIPPEEAQNLLEALVGAEYNLVIQGPGNSGKTGTLFGFVLAAQQLRNSDRQRPFPLPIRVSLAGWREYGLTKDGRPVPDASLIGWIKKRFRDDYPGLLEHGAPADALLDALWREDIRAGGNTLILFIDDLDQVPVGQLTELLNELSNRTVMITCRDTSRPVEDGSPTIHPYDVEHWPGRWETLPLAQPGEEYAREFLGVHDPKVLVPASIYRSPRLLMTLRSAFPEQEKREEALVTLSGLEPPGASPTSPTPDPSPAVEWLWQRLIAQGWPAPEPRADADADADEAPTSDPAAVRTLAWVAKVGLFRNTRFAWWEVPRLAADRSWAARREHPLVTRAYRAVRRRRVLSVTAWAVATYAIGLGLLGALLAFGLVQGYDRANHGLQAADGLSREDIRSWDWNLSWNGGSVPTAITNPVYLSGGVLLVVIFTVCALAWLGDEFEHKKGGRPQIIEPRLPGLRGLREILQLIPTGSAVLIIGSALLAGLFQVVRSGPADQLWAGTAFSACFVGLLAWLQWCSREGDNLTPADTFASDHKSARVVTITLGLAALITSTTLSWWFTSPRHMPTVGQFLWITAAAAISVAMARGFYLGAGMIAPLIFRLRPGFGVGYAHRMLMLESSLRHLDQGLEGDRRPAAPLAVTSVFVHLDRSPDWEQDRARGLVLRQIGSLIRLRDDTLEAYLKKFPGDPDQGGAGRSDSLRSWLGAGVKWIAVACATVLALLSLTGTAAVVVPRSFCSPQQDYLAFLDRGRPAQTWLENGQCVGFETLVGKGNQFNTTISRSGAPERERNLILGRIQSQNDAIPDPGRALNILFLAPLSRTGGPAINALYQLQGAQLAQQAINQSNTTYVRLIVANVGEDFTSGPSVVQMINRKFPSDPQDPDSIKAVIGVAQSRAAARESLAQLHEIPVVAGAVNGNDMRHGLIRNQDVDFGENFVSVAPSNRLVARAMLSETVLRQAESTLDQPENSSSSIDLGILRDTTDTYFSNDLSNSLDDVVEDRLQGRVAVRKRWDLRETAPESHYATVAEEMCSPGHSRTIWLFAGRGNQFGLLNQALTKVASCTPAVIAGPGALSAIQSGAVPASGPLRNTLFYSLASWKWSSQESTTNQPDPSTARSLALTSDLSTGWAATLEAYRRLVPPGAARCPDSPLGPEVRVSIADGPEGDGHNTLFDEAGECGPSRQSSIYLCPLGGAQACLAATREDLLD